MEGRGGTKGGHPHQGVRPWSPWVATQPSELPWLKPRARLTLGRLSRPWASPCHNADRSPRLGCGNLFLHSCPQISQLESYPLPLQEQSWQDQREDLKCLSKAPWLRGSINSWFVPPTGADKLSSNCLCSQIWSVIQPPGHSLETLRALAPSGPSPGICMLQAEWNPPPALGSTFCLTVYKRPHGGREKAQGIVMSALMVVSARGWEGWGEVAASSAWGVSGRAWGPASAQPRPASVPGYRHPEQSWLHLFLDLRCVPAYLPSQGPSSARLDVQGNLCISPLLFRPFKTLTVQKDPQGPQQLTQPLLLEASLWKPLHRGRSFLLRICPFLSAHAHPLIHPQAQLWTASGSLQGCGASWVGLGLPPSPPPLPLPGLQGQNPGELELQVNCMDGLALRRPPQGVA